MEGHSIGELLTWAVGQVVVAAAIWGGIRADIKALHAHLKLVQDTADKAHDRIDEILSQTVGVRLPHRSQRRED